MTKKFFRKFINFKIVINFSGFVQEVQKPVYPFDWLHVEYTHLPR